MSIVKRMTFSIMGRVVWLRDQYQKHSEMRTTGMNHFMRKGWLAVITCALATMNSGALFFGYPGLMTPYWKELLQADTGATGLIMTFACLGVGCMTLISGRLHPKMGTRFSFLMGTIVLVAGMIPARFTTSMGMVYLWAFLCGSGTGFIYMPSLTTVQNWFPHRRGFVTGIVNLFFGTSAAIMSPIYSFLLEKLGYDSLNFIILEMVVIINGLALVFAELPERVTLTPEETKFHAELVETKNREKAMKGPTLAEKSYTAKEALRTKAFWAVWIAWAFVGAAGISMVSLAANYALSIGLSGVVVITAFNLTNGIGRIIAGTLSDYIGRNATGFVAFALGCLGYILLPYCRSLVIVAVLAAFVGYAFGTLFAISAPLISDLFGLKYYSSIFSFIFVAYGLVSGVFGPALVGQILKMTGENYSIVFRMLAVFCAIGAVCIVMAKHSRKSTVITEKV